MQPKCLKSSSTAKSILKFKEKKIDLFRSKTPKTHFARAYVRSVQRGQLMMPVLLASSVHTKRVKELNPTMNIIEDIDHCNLIRKHGTFYCLDGRPCHGIGAL